MQPRGQVALGAFIGFGMFAVVGALGLLVLEKSWSAYAAAAPFKTYSTPMLIARLAVAVTACAAAGVASARVTRAASWAAGTLLLLVSIPIHVAEWSVYPVWYHLTYLGLIVPLTGLVGAAGLGRRAADVGRHPFRI